MADNLSPVELSEIMRRVVNKGTRPEILVRKLVWKMGYRYRLNVNSIPGKPDIVFRKKKKVIFVNGCFWHRHKDCSLTRTPKSNVEFWEQKFKNTVIHDNDVYAQLNKMGWRYLIIWECEIKKANYSDLEKKIKQFLDEKEKNNNAQV